MHAHPARRAGQNLGRNQGRLRGKIQHPSALIADEMIMRLGIAVIAALTFAVIQLQDFVFSQQPCRLRYTVQADIRYLQSRPLIDPVRGGMRVSGAQYIIITRFCLVMRFAWLRSSCPLVSLRPAAFN